ncbi:MAG TPA: glycoside hydrolase family 2 TIM barrel-domain containing protein [Candidatus Sulfotelmatobacter sp.]|nr:glycoside hydrolase family 2 TIM barrel-domain containing protein [Candidatus Sulfotelmatobacter sp.]
MTKLTYLSRNHGMVERGALRRVAPRAAAQQAGSWSLRMICESLKFLKNVAHPFKLLDHATSHDQRVWKPAIQQVWKRALRFSVLAITFACAFSAAATETPGEFRPQPVLHPTEKCGATGDVVEPPDEFPVSRAPLVNTAHRKPKLTDPGQPTLRGNDLVFDAGWEMIEAPKLSADGSTLSQPGVDTRDWYDATVPGTVLTTLVDEGVYPDPYFGLNNRLTPETLNKQDYWYRTEFTVPESFSGRHLTLQFNGINYYAEVWFNGQYLGHITGAFIRGKFDVTSLIHSNGKNVLAVMIAPPPDPGLLSEESVKFGPRLNGGKLCLDGPTFECSEGWDWIPPIRDRDSGIWQDVILRATGPVTIEDPQVITQLPLPDTSSADVTVQTDLRNLSDTVEQGALEGSFEGVTFEQPVTLQPGETRSVCFAPKDFAQLTVQNPRLWWPNGYGKPELYHLTLKFVGSDGAESDHTDLRFGIREMSYEFEVKKPDGTHERVEYTPILARGTDKPVIDNRRYTMMYGPENTARRNAAILAAGGQISKHPFHWGEGQQTDPGLWPGMEDSPALSPATDTNMGMYLVIKVNGRRIECIGGDWGMDDAMKRVSRERLEPYIRLEHDAHLNMIRNWAGQSTSEAFYDLCDQYGIMVWNEFWMNTETWDYTAVDHALFLRNCEDTIKRFRNHPSIALWCPRNEGVPPEDVNQALDRMVRELDGTRYYQPNSRLVNLRDSGPWSNYPMWDYFHNFNDGFTTELGASSIPSAEVMRTMMPAADLWPWNDDWAYHDLHAKGAADVNSTFERMTARYGAPTGLEDCCCKAQMENYETYRAIIEGFNSRLWNNTSGVIIWMTHPSWPSLVMQLYTWDYDPNASLFGAMKGAEPVHIQMTMPECKIQVINHRAEPLNDVTATATIYDLSGHAEQSTNEILTAAAGDCTDAFTLDFPADGAHFVLLELRDHDGKLLSRNFYWHARDEHQLRQLNGLPQVAVKGKWHLRRSATDPFIEGRITNTGNVPALEVRLTLRDAKTGQRILPAYYDDNYICLLPGETRNFRIDFRKSDDDKHPEITLDGWNIKPSVLR